MSDIVQEIFKASYPGGPRDHLTVAQLEAVQDGDHEIVFGEGSPDEWLYTTNPVEIEQ